MAKVTHSNLLCIEVTDSEKRCDQRLGIGKNISQHRFVLVLEKGHDQFIARVSECGGFAFKPLL
jgi:hypothetical protein